MGREARRGKEEKGKVRAPQFLEHDYANNNNNNNNNNTTFV
jgi:hypothetical protein